MGNDCAAAAIAAAMFGVMDAGCRSFAVPNVLITDGSVLPTGQFTRPLIFVRQYPGGK